jgi:DNA-binding MarR family transcriptional regulator
VTPQAMHKVMRSLEDAGLVERTTPPRGGRTLEAVITTKGQRALTKASPLVSLAEDRALILLDDHDREELRRILRLATSLSNP